ncbi:hypothetical protein ACEPAF_3931 [Sanghuangporus sanghuang]
MDTRAHLRQIIQLAEALQEKTRPFSEGHSGPSIATLTDPDDEPIVLNVPSASHLVCELMEVGATRDLAKAISEKFHAYALRLAEFQVNVTYMDTLRKLRHCPPCGQSDFTTAFQEAQHRIYCSALSKRKEEILKYVTGAIGETPGLAKEGKFDQNFVPFLEKCFSRNQRPSREDKELLAEKTGMSYRQIHVWFQNRRSRTRRSLGQSEFRNEELTCCSRASSVTLVEDDPLSRHISPSYAFPAVYPPEIKEDPFPCRFGDFYSFAKPCWSRFPSTTEPPLSKFDVSTLTTAFEKLQINDDSESKTRRKKRSTSVVSKSVTKPCYEMIRPMVIRSLRTPLAALVRTEITCLSRSSGTSSQENDLAKQNEGTSQTGEHSKAKSRKLRQRKAVEQGRTKGDQQSLPPTEPANEQQLVAPAVPLKTKKARKKTVRSKPATRKGCKILAEPEVAVETVREPEEPSSSHPSPTTSIESLPSLSYSTASSSSSTYSVSPPASFAMLSDGGLMSSPFDEYRSSSSSLTLPPSLTFDDHPPPPATFTSDGFSFDLPKGPLDYSFDFGIHGYPYSDSFDSLAQGLGSSSESMSPLSFELPYLAS